MMLLMKLESAQKWSDGAYLNNSLLNWLFIVADYELLLKIQDVDFYMANLEIAAPGSYKIFMQKLVWKNH